MTSTRKKTKKKVSATTAFHYEEHIFLILKQFPEVSGWKRAKLARDLESSLRLDHDKKYSVQVARLLGRKLTENEKFRLDVLYRERNLLLHAMIE